MARVVVVHGVGQQFLGRNSLRDPVAAALADGVELAGAADGFGPQLVDVAFYGNVFRAPGAKGDGGLPQRATDLDDPFEIELLDACWAAAAQAEPDRVPPPEGSAAGSKAPTPQTVQRAMNALLRSRFLSTAVAERFLLGVLRQVRRYFTEEPVRARAVAAVAARIEADTTVLVGHSLGSVVAYEALCAHPHWPVRTLVTLGSPLGMPKLVFDRLRPSPEAGRGHWPEGLESWANVCDRHDVVASVKELAPWFTPPAADGERPAGRSAPEMLDVLVDNGWKVHDLLRHLTARETGEAIGKGLGTVR
ncbi:PGAP1-like alpha/beta domain-containing protein [Streptomyces sp. NPDC003753]|uniref:PGAP1-like alpha/beta domain-containing protein n=1 Tax=Streptomyces sp. Y2F8-2 TaxID=2759675 RepID=UPI001904E862|nr:hypothetical protein [Streptomyces sp. Y2F8-2]GHK04499.1 hypothetical protein SY2F82_62960 [Streptomyces sp. Y2F8-2]